MNRRFVQPACEVKSALLHAAVSAANCMKRDRCENWVFRIFLHGTAMNLARMMTDKFFIEDRAGARSGPFKTKFGSGTIMVFQNELNVSEGDRIIQPLSDGSERVYVVEGASFNTGSRNIPGHFAVRIAEQAAAQGAALGCQLQSPCAVDLRLQGVAASLQLLAQAIDGADAPPECRNEAQAALRAVLDNPVVSALLAGARQTA